MFKLEFSVSTVNGVPLAKPIICISILISEAE